MRIFILGFILCPVGLWAQENASVLNPADVNSKYLNVALVPYMPNQHISDADVDLSKANLITTGEVRASLRKTLDLYIAERLKKSYDIVRLYNDTITPDLRAFYNSLRYEYQTPDAVLAMQKKKTGLAGKWGIATDRLYKKDKTPENGIDGGKIVAQNEDSRYFKAILNNKDVVPFMAEKFYAGRFILINMIEIKNIYESCIDIQNKNYEKEISVHFSIVDASGNTKYGDVVTVRYSKNSNNLKEFTQRTFPIIADYIVSHLK